MSVVLFRVDERLIHGQVVVGWGSKLHPDRIVVVDDDLAQSTWEQELYVLGLPPGISSAFVSVDSARAALPGWQHNGERVFVLTRDVATMLRIARKGRLQQAEVNVGGIHHATGRRQVLPYVYLSEDEHDALRALRAEGVTVTARDLPASRRFSIEQLLGETPA